MAERQPNQPMPAPENPQPRQGRAEGRESLQGPTTVDKSKQLQPQQESAQGNPPLENSSLTKRRGTIFERCIIRGLMPSSEEVERRREAGEITEELARQQKGEALRMERMYSVGNRLADVQRLLDFRNDIISKEEELRLREEELRLKELWRSLQRKDRG